MWRKMMKTILPAILVLLMLGSSRIWAANDAGMQSGTFDSDGVKIAYVIAGSGEPVVLIHGLDSSAAINWQLPGTFNMLAQNYRVVALDLRGHGKSDKPTDESAYGKPMVEDVVRLMDHLNIQRAHIVGYSLGGIVAMRLVIDHPDRVMSVALGGIAWLREGSGLQEVWEKMPGRFGARTPIACMHGVGKLAASEDEIKSVKIPVEILVGDHDPCKRLYVDPLATVRKDWPVVEIQGAGHISCIFKQQFKDELKKWIDKNAGSAKD
jgi:pimeloyl-ACP methyl ester carboxylesterase